MPARRIIVTGRVQGVFFRAETQKQAQGLGLTGWVRNTAEGAVEVHAEGSEESLEALQKWCRKGPERAQVRDVHAAAEREEQFASFDIRY